MRICCKCKEKEPRNKSSSYCKGCHNEYQKAYYKINPKSINSSHKRRIADIRSMIKKAKDKPCMDCNKKYPYYVMDLDHVRGTKKFDLSVASRKYRSFKIIQQELDKCEVVCSNCHRHRTFSRMIITESYNGSTNAFEALNESPILSSVAV